MDSSREKIKVMLFEDNDHLRDSLSMLIDASDDFTCMGAFPNATQIIQNLTAYRPQVVLMDIEMPGRSGIEATSLVKKSFPDIPILVLTAFDDDDKIFHSLCAGGSGYLLKSATPDQILQALSDVHAGGAAFSPSVAKRMALFFQHKMVIAGEYHLTDKEKQILQYLSAGKSYKMIADALGISVQTVKSHLKNVYRKLHVNNNTEAVAKAIRQRLV
jgi:DNA-binding NarL/FixJ family response regulator